MKKVTKVLFLLIAILNLAKLHAGLTPDAMFANLNVSMEKIYPGLLRIMNLAGYFMILKAIFMLKKLGHKTAFMGGSGSLMGPVFVIIIGIVLINAHEFIKTIVTTLYGGTISNTKSWEASKGGDSWFTALTPMIGLIQVIGLIAFFRGVIILTKACNENSQPGNVSKGLMHVLGGVMAINITGTIDLIDRTLGF